MESTGSGTGIGTSVALGTALGLRILRNSKRNFDKQNPERVRFPKILMYLCWILIVIGLFLAGAYAKGLVDDGAAWTSYLVVPAVGIYAIAGIVVLLMYRNWYVTVGDGAIQWRTRIFGRTHAMTFDEIAGYKLWEEQGVITLKVGGHSGKKLTIPAEYFDAAGLLNYLTEHPHLRKN